jgi:hydrogenase maturation protease
MGNCFKNCGGNKAKLRDADLLAEPVLIIGYGNLLRRDDGVGVVVAERLAARPRRGVQIIACPQLTPELAEPISRAAAVVFVDAAASGPRQVRMRRVRPTAAIPFLAHGSSPALLLGLARALFGRQPPAWLLTIPGEDFGLGEGFSALAEAGVRTALEQLEAWLRRQQSTRPRAA